MNISKSRRALAAVTAVILLSSMPQAPAWATSREGDNPVEGQERCIIDIDIFTGRLRLFCWW